MGTERQGLFAFFKSLLRPREPGTTLKIPKIPGPPSIGPVSLGRTTEKVATIEDLSRRLNEQRRALGAPPVEFPIFTSFPPADGIS